MSTNTKKSYRPFLKQKHYTDLANQIILFLNSNPNLTPETASIPKNTGGYRTLYIPGPEHKLALTRFLKLSKFVYKTYGPSVSKSILNNLNKSPRDLLRTVYTIGTLEDKSLISLDLKSAFESVNIDIIHKQLLNLAAIKVINQTEIKVPTVDIENLYYNIINSSNFKEFVFYKNRIPTGYPTSNFLYEHAMLELDKRLKKLTIPTKYKDLIEDKPLNLRIFRYVDDIKIILNTNAVPFIGFIKESIEELGFIINKKKISVKKFKEGWKVFNITIKTSRRAAIPKKVRNKLKGLHYALSKATTDINKKEIEAKIKGIFGYYWPNVPGAELLKLSKLGTSTTRIE